MEPLPRAAPLATKLRNTLVQYHGIADSEWRVAKKTVSGRLQVTPWEQQQRGCDGV